MARGLKGRGVRGAAPPAGSAPDVDPGIAPPGRGGGGGPAGGGTRRATAPQGGGGGRGLSPGERFLRDRTFYKDESGDFREYTERNQAASAPRKFVEGRIAAIKDSDPQLASQLQSSLELRGIEGLTDSGRPFVGHARPGSTPEVAARKVGATPERLAAAAAATYPELPPEDALQRVIAEMGENYRISEPHIQGIVHGTQRAARGIGRELLSDNPDAGLWDALNIQENALRERYGADIGIPEWVPRMKDLPPVQTGFAYGALAAGAGAAGLALANHLMAKGAQQSNPVDYAAAVQALNAYG